MAIAIDQLSVDDVMKELGRFQLFSSGTWGYRSGTGNSTENQPGRIVSITIIAPQTSDASFTVGSYPSIAVPAGTTFVFNPAGLTTASVSVVGSASWVVERVV